MTKIFMQKHPKIRWPYVYLSIDGMPVEISLFIIMTGSAVIQGLSNNASFIFTSVTLQIFLHKHKVPVSISVVLSTTFFCSKLTLTKNFVEN